MKKFSLTALIAGAALFVTMGVTSLSAEDMNANTANAAMESAKCCQNKSGELKKIACFESKAAGKECTCNASSKVKKEAPKAAMKCGSGKCG